MASYHLFPIWHWIIPIVSILTLILSIVTLTRSRSTETHSESEAALFEFIRQCLGTFIKKQCVFFSSIIALFTAIGLAMVVYKLHHGVQLTLLVWGIVTATALAVSIAVAANRMSMQISHQSPGIFRRIGHALLAIIVSVSVLDIWVWITLTTESIARNWFGLGSHVINLASASEAWHSAWSHSTEAEHIIQHNIVMISLMLAFGVVIHALFIVFSSRIMAVSLDRTNDDLNRLFPGLGRYDLRNPIGIPSTLVQLVYRSWTKTSIVHSVVASVILGAIGIEAVTASEGLSHLSPGTMSLGLLLSATAGASCVISGLLFAHQPVRGFGFNWITMAITGAGIAFAHDLSHRFLAVYGFTLVMAIIFFGIAHFDNTVKRWIEGRLERFFVVYTLGLCWIGITFWLCGGHDHIVLGINGIGLSTLVMLAASMPMLTEFLSHSVRSLNTQYQLLLGQDVDARVDNHPTDSSMAIAMLTMGSSWVWYFVFMDWLPWVLSHSTNPSIIRSIIQVLRNSLDVPVSPDNWIQHLHHLTVLEIDALLGMSPADPDFIMGIFVSIMVCLLVGIGLLRCIRWAHRRIVRASVSEINHHPEIIEGKVLPDYSLPLNSVTSIGFWGAIGIELGVFASLIVIAIFLGWGGYAGACIGLIVMEGFVYIGHVTQVKDDLTNELDMGAIVVSLLTRSALFFICLFSSALLHLGLDLIQ